MDNYEDFHQIAIGAFSHKSVFYALSAMHMIQRRYPQIVRSGGLDGSRSFPSAVDDTPIYFPIPSTSPEWVAYAHRVAEGPSNDIPRSLSCLAADGSLSPEILNDYLGLLRPKSLRVEILNIRQLQAGVNELDAEGLDRPTIIPFQQGDDEWCFAVAYHDCIHWYNSNPSGCVPEFSDKETRPTISGWTGPKQARREDSGIFMLLGIRCIQQGSTHISQDAAQNVVASFRSRMLIELLCEEIDPSDGKFETLLMQERDEQSLFFDDAMNGMSVSPRPRSVPHDSPPSVTPSHGNALGTDHPRRTPARSPRLTLPDLGIPPVDHGTEARSILDLLSEAVLLTRRTGTSLQGDLSVLWHSVKKGGMGSVFYERYNAMVFYDTMHDLPDQHALTRAMVFTINSRYEKKMREVQNRCEFWSKLCNLRKTWGVEKYALLLCPTRPGKTKRERAQILEALSKRLDDNDDPLELWLKKAGKLCSSIVSGDLPSEKLMIDLYHMKHHTTISDPDFDMYTSADPRQKVPLCTAQTGSPEP